MRYIIFITALVLIHIQLGYGYVSPEEHNTIRHLHNLEILSKDRSDSELNAPISAKDAFSVTIKTLGVVDQMDNDRYMDIQYQYSDAFMNLYNWQDRTDADIRELKHDQETRMQACKDFHEDLLGVIILTGIVNFIAAIIF